MKSIRAASSLTFAGYAIAAAFACSCAKRTESPSSDEQKTESARFEGTALARWPDEAVARGVRAALATQLGPAGAASIAIDVKHGVAVLTGATATLLAKQAAAASAATVRGVRSVVNQVRVIPPPRPDGAVHEDVTTRLRALPFDADVTATVTDGVVTLIGSVGSHQQAQAAAHAAAGVAGVVDVDATIDVVPQASRADEAIERDVQSRLRWALPLEAPHLAVSVDEGVVRLRGRVGTPTDFNRAQMLSRVTGARAVDTSELEVDPDVVPIQPDAASALPASDEAKAQAVRDALFYDPRVVSFRLTVTVELGEATLTGEVPSLFAKQAAIDGARHTAGITSVRDRITIVSPPASDEEIAADVRAALTHDPIEALSKLRVDVSRGRVEVRGRVEGELAHQRALAVIASIPGVRALEDRLLVIR